MGARREAANGDGVSLRVHLGCGSVYLRNYLNVDLPLPHVALAKDEPGLVEEYITDESAYYSRHQGKTIDDWRKGPNLVKTVCDCYGSFQFIPVRNEAASELLARQVLEHLNVSQAREAIKECFRVLAWGGHLRIDVPDPEATLELYRQTGDKFYFRHLFGPRLDVFGYHTPYSRDSLTHLVAEAGFNLDQEEENIHSYPAFCLRFVKS